VLFLGLDQYRAGARYLISDTISHRYTDTDIDTDTGLYKVFVLKMRLCAGYRFVQVIYVCGVYARKCGIGLKL